jgi:putative molybdopterin biosynthesis protein
VSRDPYLHDIPLEQAQARWEQALRQASLWGPLGQEEIPLEHALGRVTAEPVWARTSSPNTTCAAMDGYAVVSTATHLATDRRPVRLAVGREAEYVDTGDPLPLWADAVVPIEVVETETGIAEMIVLRNPVPPWSNLRPVAEDIAATELVLPSRHLLRPVDLGALASAGITRVVVFRRPRVAVLPTGDELVPVGQPAKPGEIIESNSLVLAGQVETWGGVPQRLPISPDNLQALQEAVRGAAADSDLILINAGSSAGSEDHTADVIRSMGRVLVHGVAVRPGHPVILGVLESVGESSQLRVIPVIGVPGFPVSAALTGEIFVRPLLALWGGRRDEPAPSVQAFLTRKVHTSGGDDEYLRVAVARVGERLLATPLSRGAGVITSLVRADGFVIIPRGTQGHEPGEPVFVHLNTRAADLDRTILALGSHDLTLDLLADRLAQRGRRLISANLGSLGGLLALARGEAHFGGCHLLDPATGEYNVSYVRKYLPNRPAILLGFVRRTQGLLVAPGNPKRVVGLADLASGDVKFVNRQRGAGTRLLLDHLLSREGIDSATICGYAQETYTHLAVAATVASGQADCGLGVEAAAHQFGLEFIPLAEERYDLIVPEEHYRSEALAPLLETLHDSALTNAIRELPGYSLPDIGKVIEVINGLGS